MVYSPLQGRLAQRESAAFTRQRSLVQTQHRPLVKFLVLQVIRRRRETIPDRGQGLCAATVQQPKQISWKLEKGFLARRLIGRCFASTRNDQQTILLLLHGRGRQFDRASPANEDGP